MNTEITRTKAFEEDAVNLILNKARTALAERGVFLFSLCGGKTPVPIYSRLARAATDIDWEHVIITFGDERCVPPSHADSNFRMVKESLLDGIRIPPSNVFRMKGEIAPDEAASAYEAKLRKFAGESGWRGFAHDLVLLGLGDDGHTASLFPGTSALSEERRWVVSNYVAKLSSHRLTFTFPLINSSRHVCFLVNDRRKEKVLNEVIEGVGEHPASHVLPVESVTWLVGE